MRSVVVVLPASMCAMIPMLRVLWSVNLRGMARSDGCEMNVGVACSGQKNGPLGPTRAAGRVRTGSRRYLLEVISILIAVASRRAGSHGCAQTQCGADYSR